MSCTSYIKKVYIGKAVDDNRDIEIGDVERRSGLYVLGKPGMGKTSLLITIALQDIRHGHGVFFLDPHGDAIVDIIRHLDNSLHMERLLFFDPDNEGHSFGINLLFCPDVTSWKERKVT